jgi:hypothetical protein
MTRTTRPADDPEAKFETDERPTNPSAPAPEELAMQTWLASETRAIGPRHRPTSRFRAVAVAALEGGAARVSHVDVLEANAKALEKAPADPAPPPPPPPEPVPESVPEPETPAPATVEEAPSAPTRLGPRGTVRIEVRPDRGPTGTVRMRRSPSAPDTQRDDGPPRRAARVRWMVVSAFIVLCVFDVAWISIRAAPRPASSPAASSSAALQGGQAAQTEEVPAQTPPLEDPAPPAATTSAVAPSSPRHPGSPPAKHAPKRATTAASVF